MNLKSLSFLQQKIVTLSFFFNVFHKKKYLENLSIRVSDQKIEISEKIQLDEILYNIKLVYEDRPINLRRLEIIDNNEKTQMGFYNHILEQNFESQFFSMIDPYLN